jgi:hypothetical protein
MKECHNIGYLTAIISEDVMQCALKTTCMVIFVIMWAFQKYTEMIQGR